VFLTVLLVAVFEAGVFLVPLEEEAARGAFETPFAGAALVAGAAFVVAVAFVADPALAADAFLAVERAIVSCLLRGGAAAVTPGGEPHHSACGGE
jgi:hypothetical protein